MREFEQMECNFLLNQEAKKNGLIIGKKKGSNGIKNLGIPQSNLKFHNHEKLAHYAKAAIGGY